MLLWRVLSAIVPHVGCLCGGVTSCDGLQNEDLDEDVEGKRGTKRKASAAAVSKEPDFMESKKGKKLAD